MLNFVMAFMFISQALCIIDIEITQDAFTAWILYRILHTKTLRTC